MTTPTSRSTSPWPAHGDPRGRRRRDPRRLALLSVLCFWVALLALALPTAAVRADSNTLLSYGATASGAAIQPYAVNDSFLNVPISDQAAPYAFVSMDNTPGAEAKAAYFFPGNAGNAVFNTQGVPAKVPNGLDVRYPSNNTSTSQSVGSVDDQNGDQVSAATQSGQVAEGSAQAMAAEANYQFGPTALSSTSSPPAVPTPPSLPTPPVTVPNPPVIPTAPSATPTNGGGSGGGGAGGGGGGSSTPTPGTTPGTAPGASPSPTPCKTVPIIGTCLGGSTGGSEQANGHGGSAARPAAVMAPPPLSQLPDPIEQALTGALNTAAAQNPTLKSLIQSAQQAAPNPALPYASGDLSSVAVTRATDGGVGVGVATHAAKLQLFQGLITFTSVDSVLQAVAPASGDQGSGTINTTITGAAIGGVPVTIDGQGVHVVDQNASSQQVQQLSQQLNAALAQAGMQITLTPNTTKTDSGYWEGAGGGLQITAELNPGGSLPSPANGVPATHVNFTIAQVTASIYAVGQSESSGSGGGEGSGCFLCGGFGGGFGFGFPGSSGSGGSSPSGGTGEFLGLAGGQLLAILFIVEGLSTAAVASAARHADVVAKAAKPVIEEETK